jgi:hypothetical protein
MAGALIILLLIGSLVGGLILWGLAKSVGKISNASFGNSFLICLISSFIIMATFYIMGSEAFKMGFAGIFVINLIILSIIYTTVGKFIWKCKWIQSIKANIIWIIVYAIIMGSILSNFS